MKIKVIGCTNTNYTPNKDEIEIFCGKSAGICYMPSTYEKIENEDREKTLKRINLTKTNGHHSVYDHARINFYIEDMPKALAMILNNEKDYSTSEKSARYTKMKLTNSEQELYDKWKEIFEKKISDKYKEKYPNFFTDNKIAKLAQENARYLTSIFTPTAMVHTLSYRQLNYIYGFMQKAIQNEQNNKIYDMLKPAMQDFCSSINKACNLIDQTLMTNPENRTFSLFEDRDLSREEHFGYSYFTTYKGSYAQFAQIQRHRSIDYSITLLDNNTFYVPPIIANDTTLYNEWIQDCEQVSSRIPQATMVQINESGNLQTFVDKLKKRKCTHTQLESAQQVNKTLDKYYFSLKARDSELAKDLEPYRNGARCTFPNYKCASPCGFKLGINEEREI